MNRPSISIVIPAYNEERHVRACLQSIQQQTVQPYEVIVVDNNSTDATAAIARSFPFVRLIFEPKQGIVYARNAGFDAAVGDIIGRVDADCQLPVNWVEHVQQFFANPDHADHAWTGGARFSSIPFCNIVSKAYNTAVFPVNKLLIGHYTLWGSNMALPALRWRQVRHSVCTRTDIHEDLDLAMHLQQAECTIIYDATIVNSAVLRRVTEDRNGLWQYLQWWPRTLRVHKKRLWLAIWIIGVLPVYGFAYLLALLGTLHTATKRVRALYARWVMVRD